ncbi:MAG TPA: hypothetical protein PLL10_10465 [Elusimicrobiales bacterium]|nr:hypothetical protein [Elusimicrobiales bacterium]
MKRYGIGYLLAALALFPFSAPFLSYAGPLAAPKQAAPSKPGMAAAQSAGPKYPASVDLGYQFSGAQTPAFFIAAARVTCTEHSPYRHFRPSTAAGKLPQRHIRA